MYLDAQLQRRQCLNELSKSICSDDGRAGQLGVQERGRRRARHFHRRGKRSCMTWHCMAVSMMMKHRSRTSWSKAEERLGHDECKMQTGALNGLFEARGSKIG